MDESLINIRHERSKKDFPKLKLEDGEYVEFAFSRAKVCLFLIWGVAILCLAAVFVVFLLAFISQSSIDKMGYNFMLIILFSLFATILLAGAISTTVHYGNKLYITNKRAFQMTMNSPVSTSFNVIDLSSVEDVSFRQDDLAQKLLNFGTLRLSTVGDETTYTFKYSNISDEDLDTVTRLISTAKKEIATNNS